MSSNSSKGSSGSKGNNSDNGRNGSYGNNSGNVSNSGTSRTSRSGIGNYRSDQSRIKAFFPIIRTREEVLSEIHENASFSTIFAQWKMERQTEFLDYCTGVRGHRILYDVYFKMVFDPEKHPENLMGLISAITGKKVEAMEVLGVSSALIDETHSLMSMDILVKIQDGTHINVEVQKIGSQFPGERASCYSSDLVLRQYARLKKEDSGVTYKEMRPVYTIVLIETSARVFHDNPAFTHHFRQTSETGLELPLLQEYFFVPLDIFRHAVQDKPMAERTEQEAWLTFLTAVDPDEICAFLNAFPDFKALYEVLYTVCRNTEVAMDIFSEQLRILDRNSYNLMIDDMREEIQEKDNQIRAKDNQIREQDNQIREKDNQIQEKDKRMQEMMQEKNSRIQELERQVEEFKRMAGQQQ